MTMTADVWFIVIILTINFVVWAVLSIPICRQKLPKIYLIARSWLCMLSVLYLCYLLTQYHSEAEGKNPYWWSLDILFIVLGLRGIYEITRLWRFHSKNRLLERMARQQAATKSLPVNETTNNVTTTPFKANQAANSLPLGNMVTQLRQFNQSKGFSSLDFGIVIAFLSLIISLIGLNHLTLMRDEHGIVLYIIFASQFNDIAQFLCGRWLGNRLFTRKLAPIISPNKTIEGALFGSLLSACLATALGMWLTPFSLIECFAISYFLSLSGIVGDLCESAFKRRHTIKDIGTMLPGHGGILDRVDSLLIGVPVFTLVYWLIL